MAHLRRGPLLTVLIAAAVAALLLVAVNWELRRVTQPQSSIPPAPPGPIQHIVVIMQENRSFDNLFHGFPGADTAQTGLDQGMPVALRPTPLGNGPDLDHTHTGWWKQWDGGKMDNFAVGGNLLPYSYILPEEIAPYWTLARQFTLGDRMFQSNTGPSFVAHQYMIAGQSGRTAE